jgi:hypothetical protein
VTVGDRTGDGSGAPDVCLVALSSDAATVTFTIVFANRPSLEPGERVSIVLDTDRRRSTGNPGLLGADLLLSWGVLGDVVFGGETLRWHTFRWELATRDPHAVKFTPGRNVLRVVVDRRLLHGPGFDWAVRTFQAGAGRGSDVAPDDRFGAYSLRPARAAPPAGTGCGKTSHGA